MVPVLIAAPGLDEESATLFTAVAEATEVAEIDPKPDVEPKVVCAGAVEFPPMGLEFKLAKSRFAMATN